MKNILNIKRGGAFALAVLTFLCVLAITPSAHSGQQSQGDTNTMVAATTNTFILSGDITGSFTNGQQPSGYQLINVSQSAGVWLECGGFYTNSGAGASNITFRIAGSVSATQWTNNYASVVVSVPVGTNYAFGSVFISNVQPFLGLRAIENINTGNVAARGGSQYIKAYIKPGI